MARKTRQRISYVLPLASASSGHRLGVNGVCADQERSILYSAGRDGVVFAWDLHTESAESRKESPANGHASPIGRHGGQRNTSYRQHVQAHTHWINDLLLTQGNQTVVSASSDTSIKAWRPLAHEVVAPQTIGQHTDYVKCLAAPNSHSDWVAAGGLDRRIRLWDLNGAGLKTEIRVAEEENNETKGSVYALAANDSLVASGGPECLVKIWDPRTSQRVTKFVGHTDNIRSILISEDSETIMTASSDRTIKLWSMTAGRCISTLGMHNDSVWCLHSNHPRLSVFYSGDKSGFVAKTDVRGTSDLDDGLSLAILREQEGVCKITSTSDSLWIATSRSNINRWVDIDTNWSVQIPEAIRNYRMSIASRSRAAPTSPTAQSFSSASKSLPPDKIPFSCILRLPTSIGAPSLSARVADRAVGQAVASPRKASVVPFDADLGVFAPLRSTQEETIEGQNGLTKHVTLNDKRHVLTLDTAGEVTMWDILKCIPVRFFGKRELDDVVKEVNTAETVAQWCAVDTRTGTLACTLEENHCFDAEMYADQIEEGAGLEFKDDQRINLGKWVLRYLFSNLIEEEARRDSLYRENLTKKKSEIPHNLRALPPAAIAMPSQDSSAWSPTIEPYSATTPRAGASENLPMTTSGFSIGVATPGFQPKSPLSPMAQKVSSPMLEKGESEQSIPRSQPRTSTDKPQDYFSARQATDAGDHTPETPSREPMTPSEGTETTGLTSASDADKSPANKDSQNSVAKRLRIPFSGKRLGRMFAADSSKAAGEDEKVNDQDNTGSGKLDEKKPEVDLYQDRFRGTIHRIREEYDLGVKDGEDVAESFITPAPPNEAPPLQQPGATTIVVQEERPDSAGVMDLFEGTLNNLGRQADLIEKVAPMWLGELLLRNRIPPKEIVKISFTLEPFKNSLPFVTASEGAERLNANRMLRAKKILAYIAERLEDQPEEPEPEPGALRPEEYLELHCQNQLVPPTMTLATIRAHIWRGGGDVALVYRANGRKRIGAAGNGVESPGAKAGTQGSTTG